MKRASLCLLLAAACSSETSNGGIRASPDGKHVLFAASAYQDSTVRSVMAATAVEVARADKLPLVGDFSANGAVMLSRSQEGHLLIFNVADGSLVDAGSSPDNGRVSSDGSLVAFLVARAACATPQPSDDLEIFCYDIFVISSTGHDLVKVGTSLRVLLDNYQFAGNGHLIFTNDTGSLWSVPTDGSGQPVEIAPTLGVTEHSDLPVTVPWTVLADGSRVFFNDFSGAHMTDPDGGHSVLIDTEAAGPDCGGFGPSARCAGDGKRVLMTSGSLGLVMGDDGKLQVPSRFSAERQFKLLSLGATPAITSIASSTFWDAFFLNAQGDFIFYDDAGNLTKQTPAGARTTLLDAAPGVSTYLDLSPDKVSPDLRWGFSQDIGSRQVITSSCPNCFTGVFVSLVDGSAWRAKDEQGEPMQLWWKGWSPNGSRLLLFENLVQVNVPAGGGTLYLVSASGGTPQVVDRNVSSVEWIDETHVAIHRSETRGSYRAGEFILTLPE